MRRIEELNWLIDEELELWIGFELTNWERIPIVGMEYCSDDKNHYSSTPFQFPSGILMQSIFSICILYCVAVNFVPNLKVI